MAKQRERYWWFENDSGRFSATIYRPKGFNEMEEIETIGDSISLKHCHGLVATYYPRAVCLNEEYSIAVRA